MSRYYGRRVTRPWLLPRLCQVIATLHCGRVGHSYGPAELVSERGRALSVRWCAHGCGCSIVEVPE